MLGRGDGRLLTTGRPAKNDRAAAHTPETETKTHCDEHTGGLESSGKVGQLIAK